MKDMVTQPILSLRDLSVHRGAAKILDRVTLSLAEGESFSFVVGAGAGNGMEALRQLRRR